MLVADCIVVEVALGMLAAVLLGTVVAVLLGAGVLVSVLVLLAV